MTKSPWVKKQARDLVQGDVFAVYVTQLRNWALPASIVSNDGKDNPFIEFAILTENSIHRYFEGRKATLCFLAGEPMKLTSIIVSPNDEVYTLSD